jgi:hypothetical protein
MAMALRIESQVIRPGGAIPEKHTCDGEDVSPQLSWADVPPGTKCFALICDDPDAPVMTWVHWVVYAIPADRRSLPEDVKKVRSLPDGTRQGVNSWKRVGYGGPCPPTNSTHRYFFRLFAVGKVLDLPPGAEKKELLRAMEGTILAQAELIGTCRRP